MAFIVTLSHIWILFDLQGEPCEVCPVLPADPGAPVALQGKRGPKGEPGSPGVGERGLPVSATLKRQLFSSRDACRGSALVNLQLEFQLWRGYIIPYHSVYLEVVFAYLFYILKQLKEQA